MEGDARVAAVVILCLVSGMLVASQAGATSCSPDPAAGIDTAEEGGWWVLVSEYGKRGTVHHVSDRQTVTQRQSISIPTNDSRGSLIGIERRVAGWWYVLTTDRVHVFGSNLTSRIRTIDLPSADMSRYAEGGIARDAAGQWWIAHGDVLYRYNTNWERTATLHTSAYGVSTFGDEVRVLQGKTVARVNDPQGSPTLESTWSMDRELSDPSLLARTGAMWTVIDTSGNAHRYTPYGQFTGDSTALPIDAHSCGWMYGFLIFYLAAPFIIAIWVLLPIAVTAFAYPDRWLAILGTSAIGLIGAAAVFAYWLPWPFAVIYWLPDVLIGTLLFLAVATVIAHFTHSGPLLVLSLILLTPLVFAAFAFSPFGLLVGPAIALAVFHVIDRRR